MFELRFDYCVSFVLITLGRMRGKWKIKKINSFYKLNLVETKLRFIKWV